ncbi:uncharacterized protein EI90DRAFT_3126552 [Cantharellus anzutake]|uniref:uncharacterized protein n=1 Tax=Cantharellus anzutake TaxID=1750568 RepID=UPI001904AAAA|nr:uncharacterized protein EI90DRAFT_3126552 [Cantharellus anzutake]KAF8327901.1 hypothetical protein EI90DRAFT_3126552 [Cantharellus anzutake]
MGDSRAHIDQDFIFPPFDDLCMEENGASSTVQPPSDTILQTSDDVSFYVHRTLLDSKSNNNFGGLLVYGVMCALRGARSLYMLEETASVLNIVLHILYGISSRRYCPDIPVISQAFDMLIKYGCPLSTCVLSKSEIFVDLVSHASDPESDPLEMYTLAASKGFEELAVPCSSFALRTPISSIENDAAIAMGAIYLWRLVKLHNERRQTLKRLLLQPPRAHEDTTACDKERRNGVIRAYGLTAGYAALQPTVMVTGDWIGDVFEKMIQNVGCGLCRDDVRSKVQSIIACWANAKRTI